MGHDSIFNLIRVKEYQLALTNYQIPPYWAENLYSGYGSPIFLFYAPLYSLIATIFYVMTDSLIGGNKLAMVFFTLIAAIGIYLLVQAILKDKLSYINQLASRIAIYFFILNPYMLSNQFIRVATAEYAALCLAPFALYGVLKIKDAPLNGALILAASLALVILAHNLTALIVMSLIVILSIYLYSNAVSKHLWVFIFMGTALGLLLSAFFWLPAIYYLPLIDIERITGDDFDFHNWFPAPLDLFTSSKFFSMGLINLWILIQSIHLLSVIKNNNKEFLSRKLAIFFVVLSVFFIFLQTELSLILWENISYLALFQFPWRMMGPLALFMAILAGILFPFFYKRGNYCSLKKAELAILLLCIINIVPILKDEIPWIGDYDRKDIVIFGHKTTALIHRISRFKHPDEIRNIMLTATIADEYLPRTAQVKLKPLANENHPLILGHTTDFHDINIIKDTGTELNIEINALVPTHMELKRWFFIGWQCTVNGRNQNIEKSSNGLLSIKIPSGYSQIKLKLEPPPLRRLLGWIGLMCLTIWIVTVILHNGTLIRATYYRS